MNNYLTSIQMTVNAERGGLTAANWRTLWAEIQTYARTHTHTQTLTLSAGRCELKMMERLKTFLYYWFSTSFSSLLLSVDSSRNWVLWHRYTYTHPCTHTPNWTTTVHCKWQDARSYCEPQRAGLTPDLINLLHPPLSSQVMYLVIERTNDHDTILSHRQETSFLMFNLLHLVLFIFSWFVPRERELLEVHIWFSVFFLSSNHSPMWQHLTIIIIKFIIIHYNKAHL